MNPVDHPHGGKGNGGRAVTPWAKPTRGKPTSRKISIYGTFYLERFFLDSFFFTRAKTKKIYIFGQGHQPFPKV